MSYTPGPWKVTTGGQVTARFFNRHFGDVSPLSLYRSIGVRRANANLIAAAPDMLDALRDAQSILDFIEASDTSVESRDAARESLYAIREAIAKATGEEATI